MMAFCGDLAPGRKEGGPATPSCTSPILSQVTHVTSWRGHGWGKRARVFRRNALLWNLERLEEAFLFMLIDIVFLHGDLANQHYFQNKLYFLFE